MLFKSKQTVGGAPVWEVDTDCLLYTSDAADEL